ncbi:MAG: hypothetical protein ABSD67_03910 [Terracidiphilus sp.]
MRNHLAVASFLLALAASSVAWGQSAATDASKTKVPAAPAPTTPSQSQSLPERPSEPHPLKKAVAVRKAPTAYERASRAQVLPTVKRVPLVIWDDPAPIKQGQALTKRELDAIAEVPGKFIFSPAAGYVPPRGSFTLTVQFIPVDSYQYESVTTTAVLSVE